MVVAANFSVTGVEYRLLTTLIVSACVTLRSCVSIGSIMSETAEDDFYDFCSLLRDFAVFGGGVLVGMTFLACYVCMKAGKNIVFCFFYITWKLDS